MGVEGLKKLVHAVRVPVVAIGGVNANNAAAMIGAGASGVAVVSAIMAADDAEQAARSLRMALEKWG